ncbi:MAG: bifunctional hydroxymethylpyrimidine kinase/phosphomethylpyrimidine kinase [Verrucomicrobia bacterium]|jgi:hydroxymethylpyrimidine/phosphomethylpyrimidine kinase|nr:bifunctional hydroxymethylpyrimidine kinase/phosphomethylpyrimidine kinase [Verrucomicrobiota bacterium]
MHKRIALPIAMTIAGSDSGGGAGIQADLKTFAALGVHGTSAITCITAQNPKRVTGIQSVRADMVRRQIEAVFAELRPAAVKTGMLFSAEIIGVVADSFAVGKRPPSLRFGATSPPLVVDPVMVATSGAALLKPNAIRVLKERLLPLATLVTPNLDEAEILVGRKLRTLDDLRDAARETHERFGCAALVKGGHLRTVTEAVDVFFDGHELTVLRARRVRGVSTHGTGCTYSAAITALLALGHPLPRAVELAKGHVTRAIARSYLARGHAVLQPFGN